MGKKANVFDVATYLLKKKGPMSAMKLQKLLYYAQVWAIVWTEKPLFKDRIEAWVNGPVVPNVYQQHKGNFSLGRGFFQGDISRLSDEQRLIVDKVIAYYGDKDPQWLSNLTHMEDPWINARKGLSPGERGNREIPHEAIMEYYSSLL